MMCWVVSTRLPTTFANADGTIGGVILHDYIHVLGGSRVRTKGRPRTTPKKQRVSLHNHKTQSTSVQTHIGRPEVPTTAGSPPPTPLHTNTHTRKRRRQEGEGGAVKKKR